MVYEVSSTFIDEFEKTRPNVYRQFLLGSSDYTDYVTRWPTIRRAWDDVRPLGVTIELANEDRTFNFLREDKTKLQTRGFVRLGTPDVVVTTDVGQPAAWSQRGNALDLSADFTGIPAVTAVDSQDAVLLSTTQDELRRYRWSGSEWTQVGTNTPVSAMFNVANGLATLGPDRVALADATNGELRAYDWTGSDFTQVGSSLTGLASFADTEITALNSSDVVHIENANSLLRVYRFDGNQWTKVGTDGNQFDDSTHGMAALDEMNIAGVGIGSDLLRTFQWSGSEWAQVGSGLVLGGAVDPNLTALNSTRVGLLDDGLSLRAYDWSGSEWTLIDTLTVDSVDAPYISALNEEEVAAFDTGTGLLRIYAFTSETSVETVTTDEFITPFAGRIERAEYGRAAVRLHLVDKFKQLSERVMGTSDDPVLYTGSDYLPSDVAWWAVTSYGGFSTVESTSNPDIDYGSFLDWASVFSEGSVFVNAEIRDDKVTEVLRRLGRITRSAIFIEEDKLFFYRFTTVGSNLIELNDDEIINLELSVENDDMVNRQYVNADYDVDSDVFNVTVLSENAASVNSFGPREQVEDDETIWYTDSVSALDLAQRIVTTAKEPRDRISLRTPLIPVTHQLGYMITTVESFFNFNQTYRLMEYTLNLDQARMDLKVDATQVLNGFQLDVSKLDGEEVLL